jgi:hypothetical protein
LTSGEQLVGLSRCGRKRKTDISLQDFNTMSAISNHALEV